MSDHTEPVAGQSPKVKIPDSKWLGGRPPKLNPLQRAELYDALEKYIRETDDPTIPGFLSTDETALKYYINDSNLYDWQEFSVLIKRAVRKQEAYLLQKAGEGKYNPTLAIFRLKQPQHGYTDKTQTDLTTNGKDLGPQFTPEQAEQLLRLRAKRASSTQ